MIARVNKNALYSNKQKSGFLASLDLSQDVDPSSRLAIWHKSLTLNQDSKETPRRIFDYFDMDSCHSFCVKILKRSLAVFFLVFLMASCSFVNQTNSEKKQLAGRKPDPFYIPISIPYFSSSQIPCLDVLIDDKIFFMKLDLGLKGDLSIANEYLDQIPEKVFTHKEVRYGFRGKKYPINIYRVPKVKIGAMSFLEPDLQDESTEFRKDAVILSSTEDATRVISGKLGWELFYHSNLLLDIKNAKLAFCDSLASLKSHGYRTEDFIQIPLHLERGLIECVADTPNGPLRCVFDTGCTMNVLNKEVEEGKSIEQAVLDHENVIEYAFFRLKESNLGPISFQCIPIKIPIKVDAILGVEFFEKHLVFIDFSGKQIYIAKND